MVLPGNIVPPDAGWMAREIQALRREMRESVAAMHTAFRPSVQFLLGQVAEAETSPATSHSGAYDPAVAAVGWWAYDSDRDASVTIHTSSTGRLRIDFSGWAIASSKNGALARTRVGYDILRADDQSVLVEPRTGDAAQVLIRSYTTQWTEIGGATAGFDLITIPADTDVIVRARRGWSSAPDTGYTPPAGQTQGTAFTTNFTRVFVTKLGM